MGSRIIFVFIFVTFSSQFLWGIGIIENECYSFSKDQELFRVGNNNKSCKDLEPKWDKKSAKGYLEAEAYTGLSIPYDITIKEDKDKNKIYVYELLGHTNLFSNNDQFPSINLTTLKDGQIEDHTYCYRIIKSNPIPATSVDDQKCLTINQSICTKLKSNVHKQEKKFFH